MNIPKDNQIIEMDTETIEIDQMMDKEIEIDKTIETCISLEEINLTGISEDNNKNLEIIMTHQDVTITTKTVDLMMTVDDTTIEDTEKIMIGIIITGQDITETEDLITTILDTMTDIMIDITEIIITIETTIIQIEDRKSIKIII